MPFLLQTKQILVKCAAKHVIFGKIWYLKIWKAESVNFQWKPYYIKLVHCCKCEKWFNEEEKIHGSLILIVSFQFHIFWQLNWKIDRFNICVIQCFGQFVPSILTQVVSVNYLRLSRSPNTVKNEYNNHFSGVFHNDFSLLNRLISKSNRL